jgi:hypothetical protein
MDKVEKIRQKIERLKGYISVTHFAEELLSFIDSLQQEQTCNRAIYLDIMFSNMKRNEAIKQLEYLNKVYGEQSCDTCTNDKDCVTCKDGELWEGKEQPSEDLEEEIKRYIPRDQCPVPDLMEAVARHFAEWQKEQMLKDAVEGEVMMNALHPHEPRVTASYPNCPYKFGDKVKIVIIPEKEEKK